MKLISSLNSKEIKLIFKEESLVHDYTYPSSKKVWLSRNKRESTQKSKFWVRNERCKEKTWTWYVPTWSLYVILKRHETHLSGRNPRKAQTIFYFIVPTYIMRDTSTSTTASTLCHYHYCWILYEYIYLCVHWSVCVC